MTDEERDQILRLILKFFAERPCKHLLLDAGKECITCESKIVLERLLRRETRRVQVDMNEERG